MDEHEDNVFVVPEDDSITDFKSPKQSSTTKVIESSSSQRKKIARKLKNSTKHQKEFKKSLERKRNLQNAQPSIESSFFKSKDSSDNELIPDPKVALVCPLCFKTFVDHDSRVLHMKICAFRHNIPTKKLLEAIELQNRQEDERKSLGLPGLAVQEKKKPIVSSTKVPHEESDFELALALSKSLQEAEELNAIREVEGLPEASDQFMIDVIESAHQKEKRTQLEKFGFANSKPPVIKPKKRRKNTITVLQTRTEEERNRILTDKISEILMGNESITQNQKAEIKCSVIRSEIHLQSPLLQEIYNKERELWNKAKLTPNQVYFYVSSLSKCISPKEKQIEDVDLDLPDNMYNIELNEYKKQEIRCIEEICEVPSTDINENCKSCQDKQFTNTVIANWSSILNDSSASDIIIFVQNNKHIWAHRLVFYVQCSNVLLDVKPNDTSEFPTVKEKIDWTDISYDIALAFLEFIYCGIIQNYAHVLENVTAFTTLRSLARKHKIKELFTFLQRKEVEMKTEKSEEKLVPKEADNLNLGNDNVHNLLHDSKNSKLLDDNEKFSKEDLEECITHKTEFVKIKLSNDSCTKELLKEELELSEISILQSTNLSPDLFDGSDFSVKSNKIKDKTEHSIDRVDVEEIKEVCESSVLDSNKISNDKSEDTITRKSVEGNADSLTNITNFTTPKRSRYSNSKNTKNDLSIFIEKCRKENAKSISDLDSEISVTLTPIKPNRNPFHIDQDDSSEAIIKTAFKDKHVLSVLDCAQEDSDLEVMETPIIESDIDMNSDLDGSKDCVRSKSSIEEECRSKSDSTNNSLINSEKEFENEAVHSVFKNSLRESSRIHSKANTQSEEDTTCSDFDTIGIEMSMYSKYKKEHKDNSIMKYRSFVKKHILPSNVKDCKLDEYKKNNTDSDILSLSDTDTDTETELSIVKEYNQAEVEKLSSNSEEYKQTSQPDSCDFTNVRLADDRNNYSSTNIMSLTSTAKDSIKNTERNNLKYSKSDSNIDLRATRECSFSSNINERNSVASPVLISSSPEFDYDNLSSYNCDEIKTNKNVSRCPNFDDIIEKSVYLANVHIDNYDDDNTPAFTKKADKGNVCAAGVDKTSTLSTIVEKSKRNKKSTTKGSARKFERKSFSETSLQINKKNSNKSQVCTSSQYERNIEKKVNANGSPEFIRDNVTPPPNYNNMDTPKLHAELNKYGLKIQKRKRAVQLLSYIYDQLHPIANNVEAELSIISSEDEEPPMKKVHHTNNDGDYRSRLVLSQEKDTQEPLNIIDEEKQFDDVEFTPMMGNTPSIKEVFLKLLNVNKELHNKILVYEPLCINSLHAMLKATGFKCKINTLMDFLDEQCITFYVQDAKQK